MERLLEPSGGRGSTIVPDIGGRDGGHDLAGNREKLAVRDEGRRDVRSRNERGNRATQVNARGLPLSRRGARAAQGRPLPFTAACEIPGVAGEGNANTRQHGDAQTCHPVLGGHLLQAFTPA